MQAVLDSTGIRHQLTNWQKEAPCDPTNLAQKASDRNQIRPDISDQHLQIYPNPATDHLYLEWQADQPSSVLTIKLLTADGKEVYGTSQKLDQAHFKERIDIAGWQAGLYLLKISTDQASLVRKVTIE